MNYTTISRIATELGCRVSQVSYVVWKLKIKPFGDAGVCRLYDPKVIEQVREGLSELRGYKR